jgi:cell wall-associated NlpC family hydrolase
MFSNPSVLYDYLMRLVGTPYRWGGDDTIEGFDCSGLTIEFLQAAGVLQRGFDGTAKGLSEALAQKSTKVTAPTFGTILFFGYPISHVGIGLTETLMLEAGGGDSKTVDWKEAAKQNAFVRIRPVSWRRDLNHMLYPNYSWGGSNGLGTR